MFGYIELDLEDYDAEYLDRLVHPQWLRRNMLYGKQIYRKKELDSSVVNLRCPHAFNLDAHLAAELGRSGQLHRTGIGLGLSSDLIGAQFGESVHALDSRDKTRARSRAKLAAGEIDTVGNASTAESVRAATGGIFDEGTNVGGSVGRRLANGLGSLPSARALAPV